VRAGAGTLLQGLVSAAGRRGLGGLEPLVGIPATVGGAVVMNAGGRYGSTFDTLVSVAVMREDGEIEDRDPALLAPGYRSTRLGRGEVVVEATFELEPASPDEVLGRTQDVLSEKGARQPLDQWSAGCIFKNPAGAGASAGRLIEEAGMKGARVGDALVSEKHANFIVNRRSASAADVLALVDRVRDAVFARCGILLELEVRTWDRESSGLVRAEAVLQPT
jgi:UDP-N-acetylmuramate dehydrogenase